MRSLTLFFCASVCCCSLSVDIAVYKILKKGGKKAVISVSHRQGWAHHAVQDQQKCIYKKNNLILYSSQPPTLTHRQVYAYSLVFAYLSPGKSRTTTMHAWTLRNTNMPPWLHLKTGEQKGNFGSITTHTRQREWHKQLLETENDGQNWGVL